ncbi:dTDP-4-dehydrorhamnose reductase [Kineococcus sp. LSe6-4]|uniref:dTDP-4-dehydrorhamnose reductase n=1 Tax=Kineococcus halophytocola TaxID=3234027 RepID=A0ABV4GXU1_9ACTN
MRWVVTGAGGLLAPDVVRAVRRADPGGDVLALHRADLDVQDARRARELLTGADVVVNCAAWTAVDLAESDESAAVAVNATGAGTLARAAAAAGARFVHLSTDYVFDGLHGSAGPSGSPGGVGAPAATRRAYRAQDPTAPVSAYGRSKLAGERAVHAAGGDALVVRTAWLYGAGGPCFPRTVLRLARERGALSVVDDQWGAPTWTADVARVLVDLVGAGAPAGTYHAGAAGRTTWCAFAAAVLAAAGITDVPVRAVSTAEFPTAARRPEFSVLDSDGLRAAGVEPPGDWQDRWALAAPEVLRAAGLTAATEGRGEPGAG